MASRTSSIFNSRTERTSSRRFSTTVISRSAKRSFHLRGTARLKSQKDRNHERTDRRESPKAARPTAETRPVLAHRGPSPVDGGHYVAHESEEAAGPGQVEYSSRSAIRSHAGESDRNQRAAKPHRGIAKARISRAECARRADQGAGQRPRQFTNHPTRRVR